MTRAAYFRQKAQQCRELLAVAINAEVIEQLKAWVEEFEDEAAKAEQDEAAGTRRAPLTP
jgi:hypothetical protein